MPHIQKGVWLVAAAAIWGRVPAEAGHIEVQRTESQIDAAHIRLYEHELGLWEENPIGFDQKHPLLGRMLSNQAVYENLLQKFESHPHRFEHHHPFLWRVLDGDRLYHELHPFEHPVSPNLVNVIAVDKTGPGDLGGPETPGNQGPLSGPGGAAVPEPSAGVMMLSALIAGLLGAAARRTVRRIRRPS